MKKIASILLALIVCAFLAFPVVAAGSIVYKDQDTGASFTIPDGWTQEALSKDREFIDIKFTSTQFEGATILYGSTDVWSQMTASEKAGYTRAECDNSIFTKADVAEMYSVPVSSVKEVTYNGQTYYKAEVTTYAEAYGITLPVTMTQVFRIENGWWYSFQVSGTSADKHYGDFEDLLRTVEYPKTDNSSSGFVLIAVLVVAAAAIVGVVVYKKKKLSVCTTPAASTSPEQPQPTETSSDFVFCHMCGTQLPADSTFCHKCGTKVN